MDSTNLKTIAIEVGDAIKYDSTVNEIGRAASAAFSFSKEEFPNDAITSVRAKLVYDWVLTLGKQSFSAEKREALLVTFCMTAAPETQKLDVEKILIKNGLSPTTVNKENVEAFIGRGFHEEVVRHARKLFSQGHYFHAVFEASKAYHKRVQEKSQSSKDGQDLMLSVWGCDKGSLKITPCQSETDKNVQDGVKFLSAGLMKAIRNPTAHEPAVEWPISREDCLDILSFISFLLRKLDQSVYYSG